MVLTSDNNKYNKLKLFIIFIIYKRQKLINTASLFQQNVSDISLLDTLMGSQNLLTNTALENKILLYKFNKTVVNRLFLLHHLLSKFILCLSYGYFKDLAQNNSKFLQNNITDSRKKRKFIKNKSSHFNIRKFNKRRRKRRKRGYYKSDGLFPKLRSRSLNNKNYMLNNRSRYRLFYSVASLSDTLGFNNFFGGFPVTKLGGSELKGNLFNFNFVNSPSKDIIVKSNLKKLLINDTSVPSRNIIPALKSAIKNLLLSKKLSRLTKLPLLNRLLRMHNSRKLIYFLTKLLTPKFRKRRGKKKVFKKKGKFNTVRSRKLKSLTN